ncbi:MAG: hypothetical protein IJX02_08095 [Clostridia bacterium]|nr:hypothetical protein [Clostridia bacterium]
MESKINIVKRDLRALKQSSHALKRLIETQGRYFVRINVLEAMPKDEKTEALLENERKIVEALKIKESIERAEELEEKYMSAVSSLGLRDKAMVLDCYLNGMPYWKIGMEYGFSEEGARKHLDRLIKKIAEKIK